MFTDLWRERRDVSTLIGALVATWVLLFSSLPVVTERIPLSGSIFGIWSAMYSTDKKQKK